MMQNPDAGHAPVTVIGLGLIGQGAAALLGTASVEAATFAPLANKGIETVTTWVPAYADQIDGGKYPALDSTIDTHLAAMAHLIHESESVGVNAELPRFARPLPTGP